MSAAIRTAGEEPLPPRLAAWLAARERRFTAAERLAGDVSPRRYWRLELAAGGSAIASWYPPAVRDACRRFRLAGRLLDGAGVPVPAILAADCRAGFMLLEDAGHRTLFELGGGWRRLTPYLEQAVELADRIGRLDPGGVARLNPPLDRALLGSELDRTWEAFLEPHGLTGEPAVARDLRAGLEECCRHLGEGPLVPCHRDFMARNMVPRGPAPGLCVLDHQDLRLGPRFYDLASLLNDSLFPPAPVLEPLLATRLATRDDRLQYHRAAAQRTLKAIGTFESFARRGWPRHRPLIAPTLERALHHLGRLPETRSVARRLGPAWRRASVC